ncbi:MAG: ATP-binding protein [Candidatus Micrarchaeota archaeon]
MILKDVLKEIVRSQNKEFKQRDYGVEREKLKEMPVITNFAIIISGIRRCGKSTLMRQLMKKYQSFYYFDFDDPRAFGFGLNDFQRLDEAFKEELGEQNCYFFDEIQSVDKWELYIRSLLEKKKYVVITGSNASLLSKELGTRLTGRHLTYELYPFSYIEFLEFTKQNPDVDSFEEYLRNGGFPEYLKERNPEVLRHLLGDIVARDISIRHKIRNLKTLNEMALYILSNFGKEFSYNSLKKIFELGSVNSVISFISFFEDSYLAFTVPRFDYSMRKQLVNPKKLYSIDNGLSRINSTSLSEDKGRLLENLVYVHLRKKYRNIYYFKGKRECDFLVKDANKIIFAVQVCFKVGDENKDRELGGLLEALDRYNLKEGIIITLDQEDKLEIDKKRIVIEPAWKWMSR